MARKKMQPAHVEPQDPPKVWGLALVAAVIPKHFKDVQALANAVGCAYSTAHDWSKGYSNPRLEQLEIVARLTGISVPDLLRTAITVLPKLREHRDWPRALAAARVQYGKRLPAYAFELAGDTSGPLPDRLEPEIVYDAAVLWMHHAPNDAVAKAETAAAMAELAELKEQARRRGA